MKRIIDNVSQLRNVWLYGYHNFGRLLLNVCETICLYSIYMHYLWKAEQAIRITYIGLKRNGDCSIFGKCLYGAGLISLAHYRTCLQYSIISISLYCYLPKASEVAQCATNVYYPKTCAEKRILWQAVEDRWVILFKFVPYDSFLAFYRYPLAHHLSDYVTLLNRIWHMSCNWDSGLVAWYKYLIWYLLSKINQFGTRLLI